MCSCKVLRAPESVSGLIRVVAAVTFAELPAACSSASAWRILRFSGDVVTSSLPRIGAAEGLLAPKGDPLRAEAGGLWRGIGSWERYFTQ